MACMCGDMMCPSCGPAQGYDPDFETACEWLQYCLLKDLPTFFMSDVSTLMDDPDDPEPMFIGRADEEELAEEVANRIGQKCSQEFIDAITREAKRWQKEQTK